MPKRTTVSIVLTVADKYQSVSRVSANHHISKTTLKRWIDIHHILSPLYLWPFTGWKGIQLSFKNFNYFIKIYIFRVIIHTAEIQVFRHFIGQYNDIYT